MQKWQKTIVVAGVVVTILLTIKLAKAEKPKDLSIKDVTDDLPKGKRAYGKRSLEVVDQVVIHHSDTTSGSPEAYARYHVQKRGWPGIGYHFVVQPSGKIYQTNKLETISYHAKGQNTRSVGICMTGDFDKQVLSADQLTSCVELIRYLNRRFDRDLAIAGHNQFSEKSCPGNNVDVDLIRELVYEPIQRPQEEMQA